MMAMVFDAKLVVDKISHEGTFSCLSSNDTEATRKNPWHSRYDWLWERADTISA